MVRVLVVLQPQMYREAIALSIHRARPGADVRIASPAVVEAEIGRFRPHLLVHNDTAPIPEETLARVPWRVEVLYSDGMDARLKIEGLADQVDDVSTEDLLGVVDRAAALAGEPAPG